MSKAVFVERNGTGDLEVPREIMSFLRFPELHYLAHLYLMLFAWGGTVTRCIEKLSEMMGVSEGKVRGGIKVLQRFGLVSVRAGNPPKIIVHAKLPNRVKLTLDGVFSGSIVVLPKTLLITNLEGVEIDLTDAVYHKADDCLGDDFLDSDVTNLDADSEGPYKETRAPACSDSAINCSTNSSTNSSTNVLPRKLPTKTSMSGTRSGPDDEGFQKSIEVTTEDQQEPPQVDPNCDERKLPASAYRAPEVLEVWTYWRDTLYPNRRKITPPGVRDLRRISARLREGRTVDELKQIVDWAARDPWMSGRDPKTNGRRYDLVVNLFRSQDKVEQFLTRAESERRVDATGKDMSLAPSDRPFESFTF